MATAVETATTFSAFTEKYVEPGIFDQIFNVKDSPLLKEIGARWKDWRGEQYEIKLEVGELSMTYYNPATDIAADFTFTTPEIGTEVKYTEVFGYIPIRLPCYQVDKQPSSAGKLGMLTRYTENARRAFSKELIAAALEASPGANEPTSLWEIINDHNADYGCAAIGGITADATTNGYWRSHIMEGETTYSVAVSPSLQNFGYMVTRIERTIGSRPDVIVVHPNLYDVLEAQLNPQQMQTQADNRFRNWGYDSFTIKGVPVIWEDDMPGSAWTSGQNNRADAAGYEALFINWEYLRAIETDKWNMKFHPNGWEIDSTKVPCYHNTLHAWYNWGCSSRRAHGHMFNIDIAQSPSEYTKGSITRPVVA